MLGTCHPARRTARAPPVCGGLMWSGKDQGGRPRRRPAAAPGKEVRACTRAQGAHRRSGRAPSTSIHPARPTRAPAAPPKAGAIDDDKAMGNAVIDGDIGPGEPNVRTTFTGDIGLADAMASCPVSEALQRLVSGSCISVVNNIQNFTCSNDPTNKVQVCSPLQGNCWSRGVVIKSACSAAAER